MSKNSRYLSEFFTKMIASYERELKLLQRPLSKRLMNHTYMKTKDQQIEELKQEVARLQAEIIEYEAKFEMFDTNKK